jgi:hypothetical protein
MIPEVSHVHWLSNHAFIGACAGEYARVNGYVTVKGHTPSLVMQKQQGPN